MDWILMNGMSAAQGKAGLYFKDNAAERVSDGYTHYIYDGVIYQIVMAPQTATPDGLRIKIAIGTTTGGTDGVFEQWFDNQFMSLRNIDLTNVILDLFSTVIHSDPTDVGITQGNLAAMTRTLYLKMTAYEDDYTLIETVEKKMYYIGAFSHRAEVNRAYNAPRRLRTIGNGYAYITTVPQIVRPLLPGPVTDAVEIVYGSTTKTGLPAKPATFCVPTSVKSLTIDTGDEVTECLVERLDECSAVEVGWWSKDFGGTKTMAFDIVGERVGGDELNFVSNFEKRRKRGTVNEIVCVFPQATYADWRYIRDLATADYVSAAYNSEEFRQVIVTGFTDTHGVNEVSDVEITLRWRDEGWQ